MRKHPKKGGGTLKKGKREKAVKLGDDPFDPQC